LEPVRGRPPIEIGNPDDSVAATIKRIAVMRRIEGKVMFLSFWKIGVFFFSEDLKIKDVKNRRGFFVKNGSVGDSRR